MLVFDTIDLEGGALGSVEQISDCEYDVTVQADTLSPQHRLWFHFRVSGHRQAGQHVIIHVSNFSKTRGLYRHGMSPVLRSSSHPAWHRLPPKSVFYHRSAAHGGAYVLSMALTMGAAGESYELAYTYPFPYSELQLSLAMLERLRLPFMSRGLLARTPQGRRVDVVVISDREGRQKVSPRSACAATAAGASSGSRRPVVVLTSRVHPGEVPASHVLQGLLLHLCSDDPGAVALRQRVTVVLVPMLNPDGVAVGNYRCDAAGSDLNRRWSTATAELEPAIHATLGLLHHYAHESPDEQLAVFMDLHAHSTSRCSFVFCNHPSTGSAAGGSYDATEGEGQLDQAAGPMDVMRLPKLMAQNVPGFSLSACAFDDSAAKVACARRVVGAAFPQALCYTLEVSLFHTSETVVPHAAGTGGVGLGATSSLNTVEGYHAMGRGMADALAGLFGLSPSSSPAPAAAISTPQRVASASRAGCAALAAGDGGSGEGEAAAGGAAVGDGPDGGLAGGRYSTGSCDDVQATEDTDAQLLGSFSGRHSSSQAAAGEGARGGAPVPLKKCVLGSAAVPATPGSRSSGASKQAGAPAPKSSAGAGGLSKAPAHQHSPAALAGLGPVAVRRDLTINVPAAASSGGGRSPAASPCLSSRCSSEGGLSELVARSGGTPRLWRPSAEVQQLLAQRVQQLRPQQPQQQQPARPSVAAPRLHSATQSGQQRSASARHRALLSTMQQQAQQRHQQGLLAVGPRAAGAFAGGSASKATQASAAPRKLPPVLHAPIRPQLHQLCLAPLGKVAAATAAGGAAGAATSGAGSRSQQGATGLDAQQQLSKRYTRP